MPLLVNKHTAGQNSREKEWVEATGRKQRSCLPLRFSQTFLSSSQVGERCSQLRALDCTVARRAGGLLLMGEEPDQLGFRALFTIAANCPLLEVREVGAL